MARTIRDATLATRAARSRLKPQGKPYYRQIEPGLHLGYRKPRSGGAGKWVARHYIGKQNYQVEVIATADDNADADGVAILNFSEAQARARSILVKRAQAASGKIGRLTVAQAMESYLDFLETNRKSAYDARMRTVAFIFPKLGPLQVSALTTEKIRAWLSDLARQPARLRSRKGSPQNFRKVEQTEEWKRRRRSSANRTLTILKAGLNRAWRDGHVTSDIAWRRVEPFEGVDAARVRYLQVKEATRLINSCPADFRELVRGALMTGARYGELAALTVGDFNPDSGTIQIVASKSGKPRHIVLTNEGIVFFKQQCAGRDSSELMFRKSNGDPWKQSHQARPLAGANKHAKINPPISFHGFRHTWASHSVMNGVPLIVVARNLGHSDTRMVEKHYGHLAPSFVSDAIRSGAPQFGFVPDQKLTAFEGKA